MPALLSGPLATATAQKLSNVNICPVPLAGSFTLELGSLPGVGATMVQVYNLQGQSVYRQQFGPQQAKLAIEARLGAGIYLVQISREASTFTQKMSVL